MAPFPRKQRIVLKRERAWPLSRLPILAATILIAALFGLLPNVVKDGYWSRGAQASDKGTDVPHLTKRDPIRAVAAADRKDASSPYGPGDDALLAPPWYELPTRYGDGSVTGPRRTLPLAPSYWHAALPRAPPLQA
jgi:hypothetical protein